MNLQSFIQSLCRNELRIFRVTENNIKKLSTCGASVTFNETCLKERILPKYTLLPNNESRNRNSRHTNEYRFKLVESQLEEKKTKLIHAKKEVEKCKLNFLAECRYFMAEPFLCIVDRIESHEDDINTTRITKKLSALYKGNLVLPSKNKRAFHNISSYDLSDDEERVLNLGLNFHIKPKFDSLLKKAHVENLYQQLRKIEDRKEILMYNNIEAALITESHINRGNYSKSCLPTELREAAKSLRNNSNIIVRRADKSKMYVVMNRADYEAKLNDLLSDQNKFVKLDRDPCERIKKDINNQKNLLNSSIKPEF